MRTGSVRVVTLVLLAAWRVAGAQPVAEPVAGLMPGVMSWTVPATPNGLVPRQAWLSLSSTPVGDIYVAGSDHKTNSALYRLAAGSDRLCYVGDARAASEAADNWQLGETAEKFHVRPLYHRGRVYVATTDYSGSDDGYLRRRGFHWYAHDQKADRFVDLSAGETGGVAGAHASIFALALDEQRGLLYGHGGPTGELYCHDIATGRTTNLGCPPAYPEGYYMPGRYLWVTRKGRVYFTLSKRDCVQYYDPQGGFGERPEVVISSKVYPNNVFRTGTRSVDGRYVYVSDREGWVWRYDEQNDSFIRLGQAKGDGAEGNSKTTLKIRTFNVSADGRKLYFINDDAAAYWFWEMDLETGRTRKLCELGALDGRLVAPGYINHCGNETWDGEGRFYFCTFGTDTSETTRLWLTRVDPVRLKVHLGLLPGLVEIGLKQGEGGKVTIVRSGATDAPQEVVVKLDGAGSESAARYARCVVPVGAVSVEVGLRELFPGAGLLGGRVVRVVGNGNDYCAAGAGLQIE